MSWCSFRQSKHLALVDCVPSMGAPQSQQKIVAAVIEPCADGAMGMGVSRSMDDILIFFFGFRWRGMCGVCVLPNTAVVIQEKGQNFPLVVFAVCTCVYGTE